MIFKKQRIRMVCDSNFTSYHAPSQAGHLLYTTNNYPTTSPMATMVRFTRRKHAANLKIAIAPRIRRYAA